MEKVVPKGEKGMARGVKVTKSVSFWHSLELLKKGHGTPGRANGNQDGGRRVQDDKNTAQKVLQASKLSKNETKSPNFGLF